jgi:hypothetical protein
MEIKVLVKDSPEGDSVKVDMIVSQANQGPLVEIKNLCQFRSGRVWAFVPENKSSIVDQVDQNQRKRLIDCYKECILEAQKNGANSVLVPELGANLYWKPLKTGLAAREAIEAIAPSLPPDFEVVFLVPEESHEGWDDAMRF